MKRKLLAWIAEKISYTLSILSVFPIIAHVLLPMFFILIPIAYFNWFFLALPSDYMFVFLSLGTSMSIVLGWCGRFLICSGTGFLVYSFLFFIKRYKKVPIVKEGLYKYIRHPQNLGILIIIIGIGLSKSFTGYMIMFDFISVIYFIATLSIGSWLEEWRMLRSYPEEYPYYWSITRMYIPRFRKAQRNLPSIKVLRQKILIKIGATILGFIICYLSITGLGKMILNRNPNNSVLTWGLFDPYRLVRVYLYVGFPSLPPDGMMYTPLDFITEILIICVLPIFWILSVIKVIRMKKKQKL